MSKPRCLAVLLCYNDGDILADNLRHLLTNNHDIIVWNHGSTDETQLILNTFRNEILQITDIARDVDFFDLYQLMSLHLLEQYAAKYDWISWPDQDEILEGPTRLQTYYEHLCEAFESPHDFIEFNDFLYWFTAADNANIASPCERIRHYCLISQGPPKIRSWRARSTNIRWFNHNPTNGTRLPLVYNLRHYPMRTPSQMHRRLSVDRAGIRRGPINPHYENLKSSVALNISEHQLHFDNGVSELNHEDKFDWTMVWGPDGRTESKNLPEDVLTSYLLSTRRWDISLAITTALNVWRTDAQIPQDWKTRIARWIEAWKGRPADGILVSIGTKNANIVTVDLAGKWEKGRWEPEEKTASEIELAMRPFVVKIQADSLKRLVSIFFTRIGETQSQSEFPLVVLVPLSDDPKCTPSITGGREQKAFSVELSPDHYYLLAFEPTVPDPWQESEGIVSPS
jgi:hypothetical protein